MRDHVLEFNPEFFRERVENRHIPVECVSWSLGAGGWGLLVARAPPPRPPAAGGPPHFRSRPPCRALPLASPS